MIVSSTLSPTAAQTTPQSAAQTSTLAASGNANNGSSFVAALVSASAAQPASGTDAASNAHRSFRSGRLSVDMHADGQRINGVSYFDEAGQKLTTSGFWPQDILRNCEKFNIPLSDMQGLGPQLDSAGVRYKPYEQYAGTGSNHGIDLDDLATGGMGTAYDWTQDALVHLKGPSARAQLQADQALAQRLGLRPVMGSAIGTSPASSPSVTGQVAPAAATSAAPTPSTPSVPSAADPTRTVASTATVAPVAASSPAAQAMSALDELLRLITQVKTSLQHTATAPSDTPASAAPVASSVRTAPPANTPADSPAQANGPALAAPVTAAQDPTTAQRLGQMKSLLEQLLAQR